MLLAAMARPYFWSMPGIAPVLVHSSLPVRWSALDRELVLFDTEIQTDRQTDRQTDDILWHKQY